MTDDALVKEKTVRALTDRMIAAVNALEFDPAMVGQATDAALSALASAGSADADRIATEAAAAQAVPAAASAVAARNEAITAASSLEPFNAALLIATRLGTGAGNINVAIASDSTANDTFDWVQNWARNTGVKHPALRVTHRAWDGSAWSTPAVLQSGAPEVAIGGIQIEDSFNRTGVVAGSTADNGATWTGLPATSNPWSANGATAGASSSGSITHTCDSTEMTVTVQFKGVTTTPAATQVMEVYIGTVSASLMIDTVGRFTMAFKANGRALISSRILVFEGFTGLVQNSPTPQDVKIELSTNIQNVAVTYTGGGFSKTYTGQMTEAEYALQTPVFKLTGAVANTSGLRVDSVKVETPASAIVPQTLAIHNAARSGMPITVATADASAAWPTAGPPMDVVIAADGHNWGARTPAELIAALETFISTFHGLHPAAKVFISSQNPQFSPTGNWVAHNLRQAAIAQWAQLHRYAYAPVLESFLGQPDSGRSLVQADGVHPTTGTTGKVGATFWAGVVDNVVTRALSTWDWPA